MQLKYKLFEKFLSIVSALINLQKQKLQLRKKKKDENTITVLVLKLRYFLSLFILKWKHEIFENYWFYQNLFVFIITKRGEEI